MICRVGAQGQVNSPTKVKTNPHHDVTQRTPHHTQNKNKFVFTGSLVDSVEGLNSSLAQSAGE